MVVTVKLSSNVELWYVLYFIFCTARAENENSDSDDDDDDDDDADGVPGNQGQFFKTNDFVRTNNDVSQ